MSDCVMLSVNDAQMSVPAGTTVAVALATAGANCRSSITGQPRGPLCGMGICFECRVTINGQAHCRSCQIICQNGMDVRSE